MVNFFSFSDDDFGSVSVNTNPKNKNKTHNLTIDTSKVKRAPEQCLSPTSERMEEYETEFVVDTEKKRGKFKWKIFESTKEILYNMIRSREL